MLFKEKEKPNHLSHLRDLSTKVKKTNTILISGNISFTGNSKYFFLELVNKDVGLKYYFVTYHKNIYENLKKNNLPVILWNDESSLEEFNILLHSKYVFSDFDLNPSKEISNPYHYALTYGAKKISTYHGITMKRYEVNKEHFLSSDESIINEFIAKKDVEYFISPNEKTDYIWQNHFYYPKIKFYSNQPILNGIKENHSDLELISVDMNIYNETKKRFKDKKVNVIYCPTFRHKNINDNKWINKINFDEINNILKSKNIMLFIHFHPGDPNINLKNVKKKELSNIKFSDVSSDIYPCLKFTDLLITDYSAITVDYLKTNKPIIFFRPDHIENFKSFNHWDLNFYDEIYLEFQSLKSFFEKFEENYLKLKKDENIKKLNKFKSKVLNIENDLVKNFDIREFIKILN